MNSQTEAALEKLIACFDETDVVTCMERLKADRARVRQLEKEVAKAWFQQEEASRYYGIDELEVRKDGSKAIVAQHRIKPGELQHFAKTRKLELQRLMDVALGVLEHYDIPYGPYSAGKQYRQSHFSHYMLGVPFVAPKKAVKV